MRKNKWTYKRPPECKRNEPNLSERVSYRLLDLNNWSNVRIEELVQLSGIDPSDPDLPFIDRLGFDTIVRTKNLQIEHLENFGIQLFQNKLPNWTPKE
jgi:hypothetical protein